MATRLETIPLERIEMDALMRDRMALDPEAMAELVHSIGKHGVRMPVEVYEIDAPGETRYGLISGFRRMEAVKQLQARWGLAEFDAVPALVREPKTIAEAIVSMVEENEIRASISPFERGRIALRAVEERFFPTIEEAVDQLFASASRQKRGKLRSIARVAEEFHGLLRAPERLSEAQLIRIANAERAGFGPVIRTALRESAMNNPEGQWEMLLPVLAEAEEAVRTDVRTGPARVAHGGRPRRVMKPRHGLTVRRELAREGWILRFTGREATGELMELLMDEIERWVAPGGRALPGPD